MTPFDGRNFLVVDDNRYFLSIIRTILTDMVDCEVKTASDPNRALEYLRTALVDIVLVDYTMPALDGIAFSRHVRRDGSSANPFVQIALVTGLADRPLIQKSKLAGINTILLKPVKPRDLMARVGTLVRSTVPSLRTRGGYFGPPRNAEEESIVAAGGSRTDDVTVVPRPPELASHGARAAMRIYTPKPTATKNTVNQPDAGRESGGSAPSELYLID